MTLELVTMSIWCNLIVNHLCIVEKVDVKSYLANNDISLISIGDPLNLLDSHPSVVDVGR